VDRMWKWYKFSGSGRGARAEKYERISMIHEDGSKFCDGNPQYIDEELKLMAEHWASKRFPTSEIISYRYEEVDRPPKAWLERRIRELGIKYYQEERERLLKDLEEENR
jgi:hypothetical protein